MSVTVTVYSYDVQSYDIHGLKIPDSRVFNVRWKGQDEFVVVSNYGKLSLAEILSRLKVSVSRISNRPNSEIKWRIENESD